MRVLIVFLLCTASNALAQIPNLPELIAKNDPAVVKVYTLDERNEYESQGSGVVISSHGICITNFHVLEGATTLEITTNSAIIFILC